MRGHSPPPRPTVADPGLTLKAGPHVSNVSSVVIEADSAQFFNIDTTEFLGILGSCRVRTSCITRAGAPTSHVVKRFLVAKNLRYRIEKTDGASEALSAAVRSGKLVADVATSTLAGRIHRLTICHRGTIWSLPYHILTNPIFRLYTPVPIPY